VDEPYAPWVLRSRPAEKAGLTGVLFLYTFGCYFALGLLQDPARAASLETPVDRAIPFVPAFMYGYVIVYTSLFMPLFTVRCQRLFRRVCKAYLAVVTAAVVTWAVYPVSAYGLRADPTPLDLTVFHNWGLRLNYTLDPPLNLFPSLHVAIATLAALCCWKADRRYGLLAAGSALLVSASTCLVKQHFVVDGLAGAALAVAAYLLLLRDYDPGDAPRDAVAYSWRGPLGYLLLHASVLAGLYVAYAAGWEPWARG